MKSFGTDTAEKFAETLAKGIPYAGCGVMQEDGTLRAFTDEEKSKLGIKYMGDIEGVLPESPQDVYGRPGSKVKVTYRRR